MTGQSKQGLMIAAPQSGSGKTVVTLSLLRALRDLQVDISAAKCGPDYIDPGFHAISTGGESVNLDPWSMSPARLSRLVNRQPGTSLLVEAMMGLFDGASDGTGSAADLAETLCLPVLLVVDAGRQSHSIGALVRGFRDHRESIGLAGVVLNRVGSERHAALLRQALDEIDVPVLGVLPRSGEFNLPERHLGLVQAGETREIEAFIQRAAARIGKYCDLPQIRDAFRPMRQIAGRAAGISPPGQHVAIAFDRAFSFVYPHLLADWREAGARISLFSPLADETPPDGCDAVFLPGGYPELHCSGLAGAERFRAAMQDFATSGKAIYGECGGYMVLGEGIEDAHGARHAMCGLLRLETSFRNPQLHLGYRKASPTDSHWLGQDLAAHEFHYCRQLHAEGQPLFRAWDAVGNDLGVTGLRNGSVAGSFLHLLGDCP